MVWQDGWAVRLIIIGGPDAMKTAIEKPMTPGGVFDHLMEPDVYKRQGHPIPWTGKQAIKAPLPQSPTRFSTAPLISTSNWTHNPLSYCQTPGSMAGRRSCFTK